MALLGLDIGTTGTKATIFDIDGSILAYAYGEYNIISEQPGHFELNPLTVWERVKDVISRAYQTAGNIRIDAMSTSSLGEAFVMLDQSGKEFANSPIYMDQRGESDFARLLHQIDPKEVMQITGHPPHPMYSISKLMWLKRRDIDTYQKIHTILFFGDYILYKLGGMRVTDHSLAARSMCFDVSGKAWSEKIIDAAGLDRRIFPKTKRTGSIVGEILPGVADELGINRGIQLVLGGHDQIMVALGAGVIKENQAVNGIGTVDCLTPVFSSLKRHEKMIESRYAQIPYLFDDSYVTYAFNMTGGSLLKWFKSTFAGTDQAIAGKNNHEIYRLLEQEMPEEPTQLLVLPHFTGSFLPEADLHAKGAIINLSIDTTRGDLYKACMEGEAFEMRYHMETLAAAGINIQELRTVGGGSRSDDWLQIRADIFDRDVCSMNCEEAGTLGTAMLAGSAVEIYPSIEDAVHTFVSIKKHYYPDRQRSEVYCRRYEKYKQLYDLLKPVR